ncbi:MAG: hypothetical protein QM831_33385 [Kofleriaceae bacterium]
MKLLALALVAGCVNSSSLDCGDFVCPGNQACDLTHHQCVFPDQLTSCQGMADGATCSIQGSQPGICEDMVCVAPVCGDAIIEPGELCDKSTPTTSTCVDFDYDYGTLDCSSLCSADVTSCKRLGWRLSGLPGTGAVYALAEDGAEMWAAGDYIWHRVNGVWSVVTDAPIGGGWSAMWAGDGIVVVGAYGPAIAIYDHATQLWSTVALPGLPNGTGAGIRTVWGRNRSAVWALTNTYQVLHFDGTMWTAIALPDIPPGTTGDATLTLVGNATHLYIGSDTGVYTSSDGVTWSHPVKVFSYNALWTDAADTVVLGVQGLYLLFRSTDQAASFQLLDSPPGANIRIRALAGKSSDQIYGAGASSLGNLFRFDGTTWSTMVSPVGGSDFVALSTDGDQLIGAVDAGTIATFGGVGWTQLVEAPTSPAYSIYAQDGYRAAIGVGCPRELKSSGWVEVPGNLSCCNGTQAFNAIFGSSPSDVWGIGAAGNLVHRTGTTWACVTPLATTADLYGGVGISPSEAYACGVMGGIGAFGYLMKWNGSAWSAITLPAQTPALRGMWGTAGDLFAVGDGGTILHGDGTTFTAMTSPTQQNLARVWGTDPTNVYAVGAAGTVLHYDGTSWTRIALPHSDAESLDSNYTDISGTSATNIFVIGQRVMLHFDGMSWTPIRRPDLTTGFSVGAEVDRVSVGTVDGAQSMLVGLH